MSAQPHWTFGALTLRRVVEQEAPILSPFELFGDCTQELHENRSWLMPCFQDPTSGNLIISIQSFLIREHGLNILVDTCGDKDRTRPDFQRRKLLWLETLATAGVAPQDINGVLCTHLRVDHVGWKRLGNGQWVPTFEFGFNLVSHNGALCSNNRSVKIN